jgi:hypothetical protein
MDRAMPDYGMKMSPLFCLLTFVITLSAGAAETADRDWLTMPERATSVRELASTFDAAGAGSIHSEKLLQDGRRYVLVLWKSLYSCSADDVVYAYYYDGSSWVKFYRTNVPMWKGEAHIERRSRGFDLAEGAVLLLANDTRLVSLGGVPRVRTMPNE